MGIQNIIINDDELIIINKSGGQHHIPTTNLENPHRAWVDNIKACAESLINEFPAADDGMWSEEEMHDFRNEFPEPSLLEEWDEDHALDMMMNDMVSDMDITDFENDEN